MMHVLAAVAKFERDLIRERTIAGLAEYQRAFAAGKVVPSAAPDPARISGRAALRAFSGETRPPGSAKAA